MPGDLWNRRDLIVQLVSRDLGQRYRGSFLGALWSFINPLFQLAIYTFVFTVVFQSRWQSSAMGSTSEFAVIMFAGMAAFNVLSEVLVRAPLLIVGSPNYVKKVVFPLEVLPVVIVGSAFVNSLVNCTLVVIGHAIVSGTVSGTIVFLPLAYLPLLLLATGSAWFLASLGVFVRDIGQGVAIMVQMLFFLSPVFWSPSAAPSIVQNWLWINPLVSILENFRSVLVFGSAPLWSDLMLWTFVGFLFASLGYVWFVKTMKGFADVL